MRTTGGLTPMPLVCTIPIATSVKVHVTKLKYKPAFLSGPVLKMLERCCLEHSTAWLFWLGFSLG